MDAHPILVMVARTLREHGLEAILIGNAAAALQGAPVTTIDLDFLIRKTASNTIKLKAIAKSLEAVIFTPFYPVAGLYRLSRDQDTLQLDFLTAIHGIQTFNGLRKRASAFNLEGERLLVAALADIIRSKRAANRPRDLAVLHVLETALHVSETEASRSKQEADAPGNTRRPKDAI